MTPQHFQTLIRESRKSAGLTQQQLADLVGVAKFTVNQFETGKQNLTVDTLCKMLTELNIRLVPVDDKRQQVIDQICELAKQL